MFSIGPMECCANWICCFRICNQGNVPRILREMVYPSVLYTSYCSKGILVGIRRIYHMFLFGGFLLRQKLSYNVLCFEDDILETFSDEFRLFTDVNKFGPFGFVSSVFVLFFTGVRYLRVRDRMYCRIIFVFFLCLLIFLCC
jgi:hypothetical protein